MLRSQVWLEWPRLHVLTVEEAVVIGLETHALSATSQAIGQAIARTKLMAVERAMEVARDTVAKVHVHERRRVVNLSAVKISVDFQERVKALVRNMHLTEVGFNGWKSLCGVARLEHLRATGRH